MYYLYSQADVERITLLGVNCDVNEVASWWRTEAVVGRDIFSSPIDLKSEDFRPMH
jgi:hypothetical protein